MPLRLPERLACCLAALALTATAVADGPARGFDGDRQATGVRGFDDARGPSGTAKGKATDKDREWARNQLEKHDKNGDGLAESETTKWAKYASYDRDNNKRITLDELIAYSASKPLPKRTALAAGGDRDEDARRSQRLWTATDKLPEGLPGWFSDKDQNRDGQVAMHEYSRRWDARTVRKFADLDKNDDGLITPDEALGNR